MPVRSVILSFWKKKKKVYLLLCLVAEKKDCEFFKNILNCLGAKRASFLALAVLRFFLMYVGLNYF